MEYPQISYTTKQQARSEDEAAFLALSPSERFRSFVKLMEAMKGFHTVSEENSGNFVLEKKIERQS